MVLSVETKCDTHCTYLLQLHSHQHMLHLQPKREVKGKAKKALKADQHDASMVHIQPYIGG